MIRYIEKRDGDRKFHKMPVWVQEVNDIYIYNARMVNFNNKGIYLETDTALEVRTNIIIGIEDSTIISPFVSPDSPNFYQAKVMWQKNLTGGFFNFGYGTKFSYFNEKQNVSGTDTLPGQEYRKHPRKRYSKPVIFTSRGQYHKGLICNISSGGAFIETRGQFKAGQIIKLIIPGTKIDGGIKLKGEVLHFNQSGVGVIFKSVIKEQPKTKSSRN
ncbi:MAG: PilZ domain-containing protein [Desulfobacterales bacterium]